MSVNLKKLLFILPVIIVLLFIGAHYFLLPQKPADSAHTGKITYTDLAGRKMSIPKNVQRIILLRSTDIYELAALLGDELPAKLVAWGPDLRTDDKEAYDKFVGKYPALKNLPETGSVYNDGLNPEQLVNLHPDLVIADKSILDKGYKYVDKLDETGLPVIYLDGSSDPLTGPQKGISLLGRMLGKEKRASEIVQYVNSQIDTVLTRVDLLNAMDSLSKPPIPPPSVYLEAGSGGPPEFAQTYGSSGNPKEYTSWGAVLHALKVRNIADGVIGKQEKINPEFILQADPDVIIITGQHWTTGNGSMELGYYSTPEQSAKLLTDFTTRPGWDTLSAVKNKRLYSVFHNTAIILCFAAIQALARDCYPSTFGDLDPEDNLKEFYSRFLTIPYSGTWMIGPL